MYSASCASRPDQPIPLKVKQELVSFILKAHLGHRYMVILSGESSALAVDFSIGSPLPSNGTTLVAYITMRFSPRILQDGY